MYYESIKKTLRQAIYSGTINFISTIISFRKYSLFDKKLGLSSIRSANLRKCSLSKKYRIKRKLGCVLGL